MFGGKFAGAVQRGALSKPKKPPDSLAGLGTPLINRVGGGGVGY